MLRAQVCIATFSNGSEVRAKSLKTTLEAVLSQCGDEIGVIVIDQSAKQPEFLADYLLEQARAHGLRWLRLGYAEKSYALNVALREASAPLLVCIDDDAIPLPGWLNAHLEHHRAHRPDCLTGAVLSEPNRYSSDLPATALAGQLENAHGIPRDYDKPLSGICLVSGGNFSVRVDSARKVGGFDEQLDWYGEDFDFGMRLCAAGMRMDYSPEAAVIHDPCPEGGIRLKADTNVGRYARKVASAYYHVLKHMRGRYLAYYLFWGIPRMSVLLKGVVYRPWLWPLAGTGYLAGMALSTMRLAAGFQSSLVSAQRNPGPVPW